MFSCARTDEMVEPQLDDGLYWMIEMTPSFMRALMLLALSHAASGPLDEPFTP